MAGGGRQVAAFPLCQELDLRFDVHVRTQEMIRAAMNFWTLTQLTPMPVERWIFV
jgi:hypothetical protein